MIKTNKNFNINKLINTFIENKIGNYKLENNKSIKFRYEYLYNNIEKNIFIYLQNWNQLINLYKIIPEKDRHFYEIIDEKCKFFLDLDAKYEDIDKKEWEDDIKFIKQELKCFFDKVFKKNVCILEYQSFPTEYEKKYSCHLIIPDYCFYADDCKNVCNMFLNTINIKYKNIIDDKVYGHRRMLRLEGSTKVNSDRKKICIYDCHYNNLRDNINIIRLDGLITNLEDTKLLYTNLYNISNMNTQIEYKDNEKKIIMLKQNSRKYIFTDEDINFVKDNHEKITIIINKWHYNNIGSDNLNDIFVFSHIINNMIIFKRKKSFECPDCKRIHDKQHPYIFVINKNMFFHCRRSSKPINISYLLKS